jgi:transcriptional regulator with XRE-family HTH domain
MHYGWTDGKSLKALRERERIEQTQLAANAGLSQSLISLIERDKTPITNATRTLIDNAIGVIINARFRAMPAAQAQEQEIGRLKRELEKLKTKALENFESLRDSLIMGLQTKITSLETQNAQLLKERDHYKAIALGKAVEGLSEAEIAQHVRQKASKGE